MPLVNDDQSNALKENLQSFDDLNGGIAKAMKRLQCAQEATLARYIPDNGARMHHFTLRKLKSKDPVKLCQLIDQYILNVSEPVEYPARPRNKKSSSADQIVMPREQMKHVIEKLRQAGERELVTHLLTAMNPFKEIKKQMIELIRSEKIDDELWASYKRACQAELDQ